MELFVYFLNFLTLVLEFLVRHMLFINHIFSLYINKPNPNQQDVDDGDCFRELTIIPNDYKLHCTSLEAFGEFDITFTGRKYLLVGTTICCTDVPGGTEDICGLRDRELLNCPPPP